MQRLRYNSETSYWYGIESLWSCIENIRSGHDGVVRWALGWTALDPGGETYLRLPRHAGIDPHDLPLMVPYER